MLAPTASNGRYRATETELKATMMAALDGDPRAHARLLASIVPLLRAFLGRRLMNSVADMEDLVQETLLAVHTRRGTFDRDRPFTPWLFSIARHKLVDHFRRGRTHQPIEDLEDILVSEGFEDSSNAAIDVERLLRRLPAKQARVIRDTKLEGLSVTEAAARRGIGISDVKVSVHRGLKSLAEEVAPACCSAA